MEKMNFAFKVDFPDEAKNNDLVEFFLNSILPNFKLKNHFLFTYSHFNEAQNVIDNLKNKYTLLTDSHDQRAPKLFINTGAHEEVKNLLNYLLQFRCPDGRFKASFELDSSEDNGDWVSITYSDFEEVELILRRVQFTLDLIVGTQKDTKAMLENKIGRKVIIQRME